MAEWAFATTKREQSGDAATEQVTVLVNGSGQDREVDLAVVVD